jgi:hypothetical protein
MLTLVPALRRRAYDAKMRAPSVPAQVGAAAARRRPAQVLDAILVGRQGRRAAARVVFIPDSTRELVASASSSSSIRALAMRRIRLYVGVEQRRQQRHANSLSAA